MVSPSITTSIKAPQSEATKNNSSKVLYDSKVVMALKKRTPNWIMANRIIYPRFGVPEKYGMVIVSQMIPYKILKSHGNIMKAETTFI